MTLQAKIAALDYKVGDIDERNISTEELTFIRKMVPAPFKYLLCQGFKVAVVQHEGQLIDIHMLDFYRELDKVNKKLIKMGMSRVWLFLNYKQEYR